MAEYNHQKIEKKWQKEWDKKKIYQAKTSGKGKKFYGLIEFPYPSGDGLHVGHIRSNTAMDIISRKRRMQGFNVLYPIGWDAFGLPTENYAIKTGKQPKVITKKNTDTFRRQLKEVGFSFDWSREVNTTDPAYYKWTQWIFLQFYKKGLAYKTKTTINWCPKDKIGLANEEVVNGCCERCGTPTEKREKEQWMLAITKYAERLHKDLDTVDYLPQVKTQQRNWIGKSEGSEISFPIEFENGGKTGLIPIFTTRADTLFGATALIFSPEHLWVKLALDEDHKGVLKNADAVRKYVAEAAKRTEMERTDAEKEKTGVKLLGVNAVNPATKEKIPVFVADYVLAHYGTGAVMSVPAHDERDFQFAKKYKLPIQDVVMPKVIDLKNPPRKDKKIVERKAIQAIIVNPRTNKVLTLKWKKFPWTTFIVGGIEDGENPIDAAKREILEETGFKNLKYIKTLGSPVESHFFAAHKDENRKALFTAIVFELENEEQNTITENEKAIHEISWMTWEEMAKDKNLTCSEFDIWSERFLYSKFFFSEDGVLYNSGKFDGLSSEEAKKKITDFVGGKMVTKFKLRDWVFSRQRYWGEPIPLIYCENCKEWIPVPDKDLPVKLPEVKSYTPTDTGESPLASISKWVNVKCPKCKGPAKRETDTMPNWAGSSWYYLRYTDPKNKKEFVSKKNLKYWTPVDWYNGGMEHTTLHLLYSRFWHKFLYDLKLVPTSEPYMKRTSHGLILAQGGEKMSKSKGNVVNPDSIVKLYGADTLRVYEMFMGPFDQAVAWSTESIIGSRRFLERVWRLSQKIKNQTAKVQSDKEAEKIIHKTIKKVGEDIEIMNFNTAISALMICINEMEKAQYISVPDFKMFLQILAPFAPHMTEEIWRETGERKSIHLSAWPKYDSKKTVDEDFTLVIQVNGKVRAETNAPISISEAEAEKIARNHPAIQTWIEGKTIRKVIYVKNKLVNIVAV